MKRYICILVASTFLFSTVKAQLSYGVKAGGAMTGLLNNIGGARSKAGFYAGVFGAIPLDKSFSLQAELNYSAQGGKQLFHFGGTWDPVMGYTTPEYNEKILYWLNYLNLPVLVKYKTTSGFFVEAGLQAGLLMGAHAKASNGIKIDVKNTFQSFDLSGAAGVGYQLHNGLGVDLRYNRSLTDISKTKDYPRYNSVAQLGLFYVLGKH
jgi:hypothetical protein